MCFTESPPPLLLSARTPALFGKIIAVLYFGIMAAESIRILHTADWHLGRSLYGRSRYKEYEQLLGWLGDTVEREQVDLLLVAGDIFDTSTPGARTQGLYYRFLCRMAGAGCGSVVITGGNHDSPSFLAAPRELLRSMDIHVVGSAGESVEDEVVVARTRAGDVGAVVCAVPYLRDRDIRTVAAGESADDKSAKMLSGLYRHYRDVCAAGVRCREELAARHDGVRVPVIAMGHLFAAGGRGADDAGTRALEVGSLVRAGADAFPGALDYVALGHLHVPQIVGRQERVRYSGSPLVTDFSEAKIEKQVVIADIATDGAGEGGAAARRLDIRTVPVPRFQELVQVTGETFHAIASGIEKLQAAGSTAWLEIEYTGGAVLPNLRQELDDIVDGSGMEIRRIKNRRLTAKIMESMGSEETLEDLNSRQVFERCLDSHDIPEAERGTLAALYAEIVASLDDDDGESGERER